MITIDRGRCTGCGVCIHVCAREVLSLEARHAVVRDYPACLECGACQLNCPADAIEVTKGTGCLLAILREDILKIAPPGSGCGCGSSSGGISKGGCG